MRHIEDNFLSNNLTPSQYVKECRRKYEECTVAKNNSLKGSVFEIITAALFTKEGITPIHLQAKIAFVPNVNFGIVLYARETGPIGTSLKTSLRERYKQADLEAIALKYVHRNTENHLLSLDNNEIKSIKEKIEDGDIMGIDDVILATGKEFDKFVQTCKDKNLITPGKVEIISASSIVTDDKVRKERATYRL